MAQLIKKEKISIIIGTYEKDGKVKNKTRTIGELITMQGDDGSVYQFGEQWGPGGCTSFKIYPLDDNQASPPPQQRGQQQGGYPQQQGGPQQHQVNQGYQQQSPPGGYQGR